MSNAFNHAALPIAPLESLKFKANQIIESVQTLQRTIEAGGQNAMPAWPDILSKYNILLSQTHTFSSSLLPSIQSQSRTNAPSNLFEKIVLHPRVSMTDTQLDNELIPLLRNQQTTDVLRIENDTVRRLSEHMVTKGSVGVLGISTNSASGAFAQRKPEYEDVIAECEEIKKAHDQRVERAVRAVAMLRDKFDWKQRVEVELEEPEELEWDPRVTAHRAQEGSGDADVDGDGDVGMHTPEADGEGGQSSDEEEVEGELVGVDDHDGPGTMQGLYLYSTPEAEK